MIRISTNRNAPITVNAHADTRRQSNRIATLGRNTITNVTTIPPPVVRLPSLGDSGGLARVVFGKCVSTRRLNHDSYDYDDYPDCMVSGVTCYVHLVNRINQVNHGSDNGIRRIPTGYRCLNGDSFDIEPYFSPYFLTKQPQ
jgi:hypothetical protein